jgi:hypothetical protein
MPALVSQFLDRPGRAPMVSAMFARVDRSRELNFGRTARKPAPMLELRTLTGKMTENFCGAASGALKINGLQVSLMIEWE